VLDAKMEEDPNEIRMCSWFLPFLLSQRRRVSKLPANKLLEILDRRRTRGHIDLSFVQDKQFAENKGIVPFGRGFRGTLGFGETLGFGGFSFHDTF
jgi:hypothetical protein